MSGIIRKLDHIGIAVKDLEKATKYFSDILGHKVVKRFDIDVSKTFEDSPVWQFNTMAVGATGNINFLRREGDIHCIELITAKLWLDGKEGLAKNSYEVDNIEDFYDRMQEKGITLTDNAGGKLPGKYLQLKEWPYSKWAYLPTKDTFGAIIEVIEWLKHLPGSNTGPPW